MSVAVRNGTPGIAVRKPPGGDFWNSGASKSQVITGCPESGKDNNSVTNEGIKRGRRVGWEGVESLGGGEETIELRGFQLFNRGFIAPTRQCYEHT